VGAVLLRAASDKPLFELDPAVLEGIALNLLQLGDAQTIASQRVLEN
jgi:hypothetical protein